MEAELIDYFGSDDRVVDAARVSFAKEASNYPPEKNERLIKYLADHGHFTPFTHCVITLREKVPIFVARQRFKHRIGFEYNEVSRRYVDDSPEFHIPKEWRSRPEGGLKQGSGTNIISGIPNFVDREILDRYDTLDIDTIENSYEWYIGVVKRFYDTLIKTGVAPEQARMVLPQSMYTEYYVTGSLHAFARAYKLRSGAHAQKEIQDLAHEWDKIIRPLYPVSWEALTSD